MNIIVFGNESKDMAFIEEKWFGIKYNISDIETKRIDCWNHCGLNERFSLPQKNIFIATDLISKTIEKTRTNLDSNDLQNSEDDQEVEESSPDILKSSQLFRIWYIKDKDQNRERAVFTAKFHMYFHIVIYGQSIDLILESSGHSYCPNHSITRPVGSLSFW